MEDKKSINAWLEESEKREGKSRQKTNSLLLIRPNCIEMKSFDTNVPFVRFELDELVGERSSVCCR